MEAPTPIEPEIRKGKRMLKLSNLDKLFWPEEGIHQRRPSAYYRDVAPALIPHIRDRPFTMKRYPDGWQGNFFFQRTRPSTCPTGYPQSPVQATTRDRPRQTRTIHALLVNDELALFGW